MTTASRSAAFAAIESERKYQDALRAASEPDKKHEVAAYLLFMQEYLDRAKKIASSDWSADCDRKTMIQVRKVAALAVACMESHGVENQMMPDPEKIADRVASIR